MQNSLLSNWQEIEFGNVVADSAFGPRFSGNEYAEDGNIATLRTTDMSEDGKISYKTMPLARLDEARFSKHFLQEGDLVISRSGRIGTTAVFEGFHIPVLPGAFCIRFRLKECANPYFFQYFFNSPTGRQIVLSVAKGTAQQNITSASVLKLRFPVPPLYTQQRIAEILSNYDRLIDTNNRRIAHLEASIHRLYKEWFVHLRFPGCDRVKVIDGLPDRWEIVTIKDLYLTSSGGTPSRKREEEYYSGGTILWIKTQELSDRWVLDTEEKITQSGLINSSAKIFPVGTFIVAMYGATIGRFGILAEPCSTNQACCALLSKSDGLFGYAYAFGYFLSEREKIIRLGQGSAQPNISQKVVKDLKILKPPASVIKKYNAIVEPIFQNILCCQRQNKKLREARDLLLPRLMNGSIAL
jgi:type I restriction enzyme S subunit